MKEKVVPLDASSDHPLSHFAPSDVVINNLFSSSGASASPARDANRMSQSSCILISPSEGNYSGKSDRCSEVSAYPHSTASIIRAIEEELQRFESVTYTMAVKVDDGPPKEQQQQQEQAVTCTRMVGREGITREDVTQESKKSHASAEEEEEKRPSDN